MTSGTCCLAHEASSQAMTSSSVNRILMTSHWPRIAGAPRQSSTSAEDQREPDGSPSVRLA